MSTRTQLLCLVLLVLVGFGLAAVTARYRQPAQLATKPGMQRFWYCPVCGLELALPADMEPNQNFCPHCGPGKLWQVRTSSRTNGAAPSPPINWLFVALMFGIPAALAVGLYSLSRARGQQPGPGDEAEVFRFKCPACGHIIASSSYRKGSSAVCPACAELFVVTTLDATESGDVRFSKERDLEDGIRSSLRKKPPGGRKRPRP